MNNDKTPPAGFFTQVDITAGAHLNRVPEAALAAAEQTQILRNILSAQDRQNELLEELVGQLASAQRQRNTELGQWKQANPDLAKECRKAAEALSKVQIEFLDTLTTEINENHEDLNGSEFMLNEFVDRFGPRLAHLNGVLQVLAQLSSVPTPANS